MPNFDGGHYFLTVLVPIRNDILVSDAGCVSSPISAVHGALSTLPTALQTPMTEKIGINSPFARSPRTHFARFGIINNVVYNGRNWVNALRVAVFGKPSPLEAQPVDHLSTPYLMFTADFDAKSGDESELRSYLDELWGLMSEELKSVFSSCIGVETVKDSRSFQDYIIRCQIETTMSFNDYWTGAPPLASLALKGLLAPVAIAAIVTLVAFALWLFRIGAWPWGTIALVGLGVLILTLAYAYIKVMRRGSQAFPAAPNSDLSSVLKSVYLQQKFTQFAIDAQGVEPHRLHEMFGVFLSQHRPGDTQQPTQPSGVVRS